MSEEEEKCGGVDGSLYRCTYCNSIIGPIEVRKDGSVWPDYKCVNEEGFSYAPKEIEACFRCGKKFQFKDGKVKELLK